MGERDALNDAFWLPALGPEDHEGFEQVAFGSWSGRVPRLRPQALRRIAGELVRARERALAGRPVREIVRAAAAAAGALGTRGSAARASLERALPPVTGYSSEMVGHGLDRIAQGWTEDALWNALAAEFGDPEMLDRPSLRPGGPGRVRAFGPGLVAHIFSGNVPGVPVTSLLRALLVKSASFAKTASGEPLTAVAFARALAEADPDLSRCLAVTYWPGGSTPLETALFECADAIVAYGSDASIAAVRAQAAAGKPLLVYPHRVGVALIAREPLRAEPAALAERAARDVATFDQQGCVAPHCLYVEAEGAGAAEFAGLLAQSLGRLAKEWPRRKLAPGEAAAIHEARARMEFRGGRVWSSPEGTEWTVILDPDPAFTPSPLNRVAYVKPVADLSDALAALRPVRRQLQSVGLAVGGGDFDRWADALGRLGASRVVPLGSMSWPEPAGHPEGRFQFLDLVRFTDIHGPELGG